MAKPVRYGKMKDSGIKWIGNIPTHWSLRLIKYMFSIKKDIAGHEGYTVLSVTQKGIVPKKMSDKGQFAQDYSKYQLVHVGDFVMNHMDLLTGWIDVSPFEGVTSPDYRVFTNDSPNVYDSEYYKYIFQHCYKNRVFYGFGQGVSGFGRWRLPADMFLNFHLPVPPIGEQKIIAAYLDDQSAQIESLVAEAKECIEEYKKWRAAIIFEAVTKGLNKSAAMRDSGVDIIGKTPQHWELRKLRFLCDIITGNQDTKNAEEGGIYPFYVRSPVVERANVYSFDGEGVLMAGDGAGAGKIFHYATGKYAIHQRVYCFHNFREICPKLFIYFMSTLFNLEMDKGSAKSTVPSVRLPMLQNFKVCLPPLHEQKQIVAYLDEKCAAIDDILAEKESLIADLESYKKSLIYETVTGKRKVVGS